MNNGDRGGEGNDPIQLDVQDYNVDDDDPEDNAYFMAGWKDCFLETTMESRFQTCGYADGAHPYITISGRFDWDPPNPPKDGAFDAGTLIHEYTHGVSERLVFERDGYECDESGEAPGGGLAEGWSEFMPVTLWLKPGDTRQTVYNSGKWVDPKGKDCPYTLDRSLNPLEFGSLNDGTFHRDPENLYEPHATGEIWTIALLEVLWNLVDNHGITNAPFREFRNDQPEVPKDARFLAMKLVIQGMENLQCPPGEGENWNQSLRARDAIIKADKDLTGGENKCAIWAGFAARGMGADASWERWNPLGERFTNGYEIPVECQGNQTREPVPREPNLPETLCVYNNYRSWSIYTRDCEYTRDPHKTSCSD